LNWHTAVLQAEKGGPAVERLFEDWAPPSPTAWTLFTILEAKDWKHLPNGGGWCDQDEGLMEEIALLSQLSYLTEAEVRGPSHA
jgi:hypothetical protein